MFYIKVIAIALSVSFVILGKAYTTNSFVLPKKLTGTLEAGGTDFDEFVTQSGGILSLERRNPNIAIIYQECGYGEECNILAYVDDDIITEISFADSPKKSKQDSNTTSDSNDNEVTPKIYGLQLGMNRESVDKVIHNLERKFKIKEGYSKSGEVFYNGPESPDDWYLTLRFDKNNILYYINMSCKFFGIDELRTKEFLQMFINKYNIPKLIPKEEYRMLTNSKYISYFYHQPHKYYVSVESGNIVLQSDNSARPILE